MILQTQHYAPKNSFFCTPAIFSHFHQIFLVILYFEVYSVRARAAVIMTRPYTCSVISAGKKREGKLYRSGKKIYVLYEKRSYILRILHGIRVVHYSYGRDPQCVGRRWRDPSSRSGILFWREVSDETEKKLFYIYI